ncbi:MAG: phage tail tape measure protein, partial [Sedimentisphaerales bacterium]|nr:phage tail tape measure protein [Sedimentisphaerales bacterium]
MELYGDDSKLNRMLEGSKAKVQAWGTAMSAAGTQIMMAGAAMLAPLAIGLKTFMSAGDELDKMSSRVGASVEFLSALGHAANIGGTNINTMEVGIRRMQRSAMDASRGLSTAVEVFDQLGVEVRVAGGELKSTEQLFTESAAALSKIENNTQKAALATMLFGRSGTMLLPMLKDGADGLDAVMQKAHDLGIVMSTEEATAAAVMVDRWTELKGVLKMATVQIGSALAPAIESVTESLTETLSPAIGWIKANQELVITVGKLAVGTLALGAALKVLGIAATFAAANPLVLILGAGAAAALYFSGTLGELTGSMRGYSREAEDALAAGDKLRAAMIGQMKELKSLAEKESLNNTEMERAKSIIAALTDQYGDLGLRIDKTTGKITGMTEAQQEHNAAMQVAAIAQQEAVIANILRQKNELARELQGGWKGLEKVTFGMGYEDRRRRLGEEINTLLQAETAANLRLAAIRAGDAAALTGAEGATGAAGGPAAAGDWEDDLLYRHMIEDSYQRELALINLKYEKEIRAAEEVADKEEQLHREVERLEIEKGMPEGAAKEKALLELERADAIIDAKKISQEFARLTARKYELLGRDIEGKRREGFTVGTFNKFGLEGLGTGGPMERAAEAAEAGAEHLKEIRRTVKQPGKVVAVFAR